MLQIYYILNSMFRRYYKDRPELYKDGFRECLKLLDNGISKSTSFNAQVRVQEQVDIIEALQKTIRNKDQQIYNLRLRLGESSIVPIQPTTSFKLYKVVLGNGKEFILYANLTLETFQNMASNFAGRYTYSDPEEAKAMMLQYINTKSLLGFKAYKDEKTALKDKVKIKR